MFAIRKVCWLIPPNSQVDKRVHCSLTPTLSISLPNLSPSSLLPPYCNVLIFVWQKIGIVQLTSVLNLQLKYRSRLDRKQVCDKLVASLLPGLCLSCLSAATLHFRIPHLILLKRLSGAQKYLSIVIISSFLIPALILRARTIRLFYYYY